MSKYFRGILIISGIWAMVGWSSIIYLAAMSGVDIQQYESSVIDGANRFKQIWYITLPSILPVISIVFILNLSRILNAGFDQIMNLYNGAVYSVADIIDTYIYRIGLVTGVDYSYTTAIGLFKNIIGLIFVLSGNWIIRHFSDYTIW